MSGAKMNDSLGDSPACSFLEALAEMKLQTSLALCQSTAKLRDSKTLLVFLSWEENVQKSRFLKRFEKVKFLAVLSAPGMSHTGRGRRRKCFSSRHNEDCMMQVTAIASSIESKGKQFF